MNVFEIMAKVVCDDVQLECLSIISLAYVR